MHVIVPKKDGRVTSEQDKTPEDKTESYQQQISNLQNELYLEKELVKKLKQTQEDWSELIEKVQPTIQALSEKIKELKSNLHLKNQELNNVLQSLSNGLIVTDLDGIIQTFNRAATKITGISINDAVDQSINTLFNYNVIPDPASEKQVIDIETGFEQQFTIKHQQNGEIILKSATTLMKSEDNQAQGIIVNLVDITLLKRLEEEAERKNRLTAMGEIAMQVAHELRNPLGSIELFISMMKMDFEEETEEMSLVNHINAATRNMNHIISNLLEYTKPRPIVLDEVDLHETLSDFIKFSEFSAEQLQIEIKSDFAAKSPKIQGSKELLNQVFHNLFVNACQAMPEGGVLEVTTENHMEKDQVILERLNTQFKKEYMNTVRVILKDSGKGMSDDTKKKIFDPFYTTREQGTGLGLSIVHNTILSHGGTIEVKSSLESGTAIELIFPVFEE